MKNLFVILLLLSVTGCGINCIEGSQGVSGSSVVIEVPPVAEMKSDKLQPHWVDTGLRVNADQTMRLTIDGALNMCPKDSLNPKEVIVQALNCNDGTVDYTDESIYANMEKTCKDINFRVYHGGRLIDVFPSINDGDVFRVSLVPRKVRITDCSPSALKDLGVIYYSDNEVFEDDKCEKPIKAESICQHGIKRFYMKVKDQKNECKLFEGMSAIPRLQGTEVSALVDNTYTPYGNKVFYDKKSKEDWIEAPFVYDARTIKFTDVKKLKSQCEIIKELNKKEQNNKRMIDYVNTEGDSQLDYYKEQKAKGTIALEVTQETIDAIRNFTTYDINCTCGTICNSSSVLNQFSLQGNKNTIATVSNMSGDCNIAPDYGGTTPEDIAKKVADSGKIIQGLSAYFTFEGVQDRNNKFKCFPDDSPGETCYQTILSKQIIKNSVKHDVNYTYNSNVQGPAKLSFAILGRTGEYDKYYGGYHIHVERICNFMYGRKLYMYIGDNPPTVLPGDNDTIELFVPDPDAKSDNNNQKSGTGIYVINEKTADNKTGKSGKIYLGIDVRGYENQFDYTNLPEIESENKYSVNFFVKQWNPNFSKVFVMLRNSLLRILYGLPKDTEVKEISEAMNMVREKKLTGAVQQIYTNQTKAGSLWRAVQALCTLYIIFTVFGYVVGIIRCTKYDLGVRIAKVAVIVGLLSQGSWEFFSDHFFSLFIQGVSDLISAFNGELDGDSSFAFLDSTIGVLLTGEVWIRLLTLIVTGPIGWLVFVMILWAFVVFFICVIEAVIAYLFTILGVAFLGTLAPIFITFVLFQLTKTLFDSWVKMLVNFSLQPIILFAALAFLNQVVLTTLHDVTRFTVCNQCLAGLDLPSSVTEKGAPHDICLLPLLSPVGYSSDLSMDDAVREEQFRGGGLFFGLPFGITSVLILLITANAMRAFKGMSENIAHSISGSIAGLGASVHGATQALASIVGLDQETQSIIESAVKNRRFTGKSDVNIVSRSDANPIHEGESVKDDGTGNTGSNHGGANGDHPGGMQNPTGNDSSAGGDARSQASSSGTSSNGDCSNEAGVSSSVRYPDSTLPPNAGDVLDTARSTYTDASAMESRIQDTLSLGTGDSASLELHSPTDNLDNAFDSLGVVQSGIDTPGPDSSILNVTDSHVSTGMNDTVNMGASGSGSAGDYTADASFSTSPDSPTATSGPTVDSLDMTRNDGDAPRPDSGVLNATDTHVNTGVGDNMGANGSGSTDNDLETRSRGDYTTDASSSTSHSGDSSTSRDHPMERHSEIDEKTSDHEEKE
ncbi:type IV secretion system protein [Ehrlichia sp. JZT12]